MSEELEFYETALEAANRRCSVTSGLPEYPAADRARAAVLSKIADLRPLSDFEVMQMANPTIDLTKGLVPYYPGSPLIDCTEFPEADNCQTCGRMIERECPTCDANDSQELPSDYPNH